MAEVFKTCSNPHQIPLATYEFGPFRLEPSDFRLLQNGRPLPLTPKAFETLRELVEHAGHVVEKDDLMKRVWPETVVEEAVIAQNVFTLRKILGTTASGQSYIETVPKRGYRLAVPVRELQQSTPVAPDTLVPPVPGVAKRQPRRYRRVVIGGIALTAIVGAAIGSLPFVFAPNPWSAARLTEPRTIARLTHTGSSEGSAVSPDGRFVAYSVNTVGQQSLRLRQVDTGREMELVPEASSALEGIAFSQDGNWISYTHDTTLYQVPILGGPSQKLLDGVEGPVTFAPGGRQFAFISDDLQSAESALVLASLNGTALKKLATRRLPEYFRSAAWAPRRDVIVASVGRRAGARYMSLIEIAVATGAERNLTSHRWYATRQVTWAGDETGLVLSAAAQSSDPFQLWHVSYPDGQVTRITNDPDDYLSPALTEDSRTLVSTRQSDLSNISVTLESSTQMQRITGEGARADRPSWTADGRIVYESRTSGNRDLWIMSSDGSDKQQLTFEAAADHSPSASLRDDRVYFVSEQGGVPHIWSIRTNGTDAMQLTDGEGEVSPDCSPDGAWLVYEGVGSGRPLLWRVPTTGGTPVRLTDTLSRAPAISPDGKWIALYYWDEMPGSPIRLAVISAAGGKPAKLFDFHESIPSRILRWSLDGQAVTYVVTRNDISNIWSQSVDGGVPRPLTRFGADNMTFFDWSPSGTRLAISSQVRLTDLVMISTVK